MEYCGSYISFDIAHDSGDCQAFKRNLNQELNSRKKTNFKQGPEIEFAKYICPKNNKLTHETPFLLQLQLV